ncbi:hypothetical protein J2852_005351 [Azospirillum soli]|nr:hypothetical protein [Azospirillum soli]
MTAPAPMILKRIAMGTAGPADIEWLRARLGVYLSDPECGIERALHLDHGPGQQPWWKVEKKRQRDAPDTSSLAREVPRSVRLGSG